MNTTLAVRRGVTALGVGVMVAVVACALYAARFSAAVGWRVFATAVLFGAAALLSAGLLGFLFGIPRTLKSEAGGRAGPGRRYEPNTNLERVSDWLTTVIVGITLTQLGHIPGGAAHLFDVMAKGLGTSPSAPGFAGGLAIYLGALGFVSGWLATRLFLGRAFHLADDLADQAAVAAAMGDIRHAGNLADEAIDDRVERLRRTMGPGPARTRALEEVVASARALASASDLHPDQVRELFEHGGQGSRLLALGFMEGNPALADVDAITSALTDSRSAFEQYHALVAAEAVADTLPPDKQQQLLGVVSQVQEDPRVRPGGDRHRVASRLLASAAAR